LRRRKKESGRQSGRKAGRGGGGVKKDEKCGAEGKSESFST